MEKYPDSIYQLIDLIRLYLETGQLSEAEELLQKANALILRRNYDERRYQLYATQYYQNHLKFLARTNAAADMILSLCEQALVIVPACPLFLFESAQQCYKLCEYDASINYFQQCLVFGRDNNFDRSVIFPRYMMSYGALSGLGYCFFRKKQYLEAMRYFGESHARKHDENIKAMLLASGILAQRSQLSRDSVVTV
jgi:tetratricopeptide (TPR) repeat protein